MINQKKYPTMFSPCLTLNAEYKIYKMWRSVKNATLPVSDSPPAFGRTGLWDIAVVRWGGINGSEQSWTARIRFMFVSHTEKKIYLCIYLSIYLSIYIYMIIYIYSMYDYIYMYMCVLTVCVHLDTTTKKSNSHVSKNGGCQTHFAAWTAGRNPIFGIPHPSNFEIIDWCFKKDPQ